MSPLIDSLETTPKQCNYVYELESALSYVHDECRLANTIEINYKTISDEKIVNVNIPHYVMFHRLWSSCVDKPGYDKSVWQLVEQQLKNCSIIP